MKQFKDLTNNDKLYIYFDNGQLSEYYISKIFVEDTTVYISVKPCDETDRSFNKMLILHSDISHDLIIDNGVKYIVTCDTRILELIKNVIMFTKNSIGIQFNNLFGNIFKTKI